MDLPRKPRVRPRARPLEGRRVAERELLDEITTITQRLPEARDWSGDPVFRTDGIWRVIETVARAPYCVAIADLARLLGVRRQAAHRFAHAAARAGLIELATNHQDKRILQALLTPRGRAEIAAAQINRNVWLATLFNGLGEHELAATTHVVRVIRQRLERDARELAGRGGNPLKSRHSEGESS